MSRFPTSMANYTSLTSTTLGHEGFGYIRLGSITIIISALS